MKNGKQTSNLNFNVQLFWKSKNHLFWCFLSQLQYRNENQNFISNFIFQFIKKTKWHLGYKNSCQVFTNQKPRKLQQQIPFKANYHFDPTLKCWLGNVELRICQYLRLPMKIISWRFHIKTSFTFWDMGTWHMWNVCLQTFRNNRVC